MSTKIELEIQNLEFFTFSLKIERIQIPLHLHKKLKLEIIKRNLNSIKKKPSFVLIRL